MVKFAGEVRLSIVEFRLFDRLFPLTPLPLSLLDFRKPSLHSRFGSKLDFLESLGKVFLQAMISRVRPLRSSVLVRS